MSTYERRVRESFGSQAFMSTLGAVLAEVGQGHIEIRMPFSPSLTQQNGFLHAGAVAAILDSACGYAALSLAPEEAGVLTVEFKINLLSPAVGDSFVARAQVKKAGRNLSVCTGDALAVRDGAEKIIATMLASIMTVHNRGRA